MRRLRERYWRWYWTRKINYRLHHGLCVVCGWRAVPLLTRCPDCLEKLAQARRASNGE